MSSQDPPTPPLSPSTSFQGPSSPPPPQPSSAPEHSSSSIVRSPTISNVTKLIIPPPSSNPSPVSTPSPPMGEYSPSKEERIIRSSGQGFESAKDPKPLSRLTDDNPDEEPVSASRTLLHTRSTQIGRSFMEMQYRMGMLGAGTTAQNYMWIEEEEGEMDSSSDSSIESEEDQQKDEEDEEAERIRLAKKEQVKALLTRSYFIPNQTLFLIRIAFFLLCLGMALSEIFALQTRQGEWFATLGNQTTLIVMLYLLLTIQTHTVPIDEFTVDVGVFLRLVFQCARLLFPLALINSQIMVLIFWIFEYPTSRTLSAYTVFSHGGLAFIMMIDALFNVFKLYWLDFVSLLAYNAAYGVVILAFYWQDPRKRWLSEPSLSFKEQKLWWVAFIVLFSMVFVLLPFWKLFVFLRDKIGNRDRIRKAREQYRCFLCCFGVIRIRKKSIIGDIIPRSSEDSEA